MVDISILKQFVGQLITEGAPPCMDSAGKDFFLDGCVPLGAFYWFLGVVLLQDTRVLPTAVF